MAKKAKSMNIRDLAKVTAEEFAVEEVTSLGKAYPEPGTYKTKVNWALESIKPLKGFKGGVNITFSTTTVVCGLELVTYQFIRTHADEEWKLKQDWGVVKGLLNGSSKLLKLLDKATGGGKALAKFVDALDGAEVESIIQIGYTRKSQGFPRILGGTKEDLKNNTVFGVTLDEAREIRAESYSESSDDDYYEDYTSNGGATGDDDEIPY